MITRYASDLVSDAMNMAQQQAQNSFAFRDVMHLLNQNWRYCYERMAQIEPGYYSETVRLSNELTKIPPFVMNTVSVYRAVDPLGANRQVYVEAGRKNYVTSGTYHISGNDLYCWDAKYNNVWVNFVPAAPTIFYTVYNRAPKILTQTQVNESKYVKPYIMDNNIVTQGQNNIYGPYRITATKYSKDSKNYKFTAAHMGNPANLTFDVTAAIYRGPDYDNEGMLNTVGTIALPPPLELYNLESVIFDFPYVFATFKHKATGRYMSGILKNLLGVVERYKYNAFDFTGRGTNVQIVRARYNDDTGLGVIVKDYDDGGTYKELGWTPDTLVTYPKDLVADYVVSHLAKRFANRSESTIMDIEYAIAATEAEMNLWYKSDKSGFARITNVTGPRPVDFM